MSRIKVLCIGNALVADDAFGPLVYEHFIANGTSRYPDTAFCLLGVGGLDLLSEFEGEDMVVVVDAVSSGSEPGTLSVLPWQHIEKVSGTPVTSHDIGLDEVMKIGRMLQPEQMPKEVIFVGVEGKDFSSIGHSLSPEVQHAIPKALQAIENILAQSIEVS
ncbi:MAG: hydrogenase maturation protease [Deltaproteobacteria bacterium]|nr:hydrogenase maturation protease [Deltaproteobacteria bacterium]